MTTYKYIIAFNVSAVIKKMSPMMLEEQDPRQSTSAFHVLKMSVHRSKRTLWICIHKQMHQQSAHHRWLQKNARWNNAYCSRYCCSSCSSILH